MLAQFCRLFSGMAESDRRLVLFMGTENGEAEGCFELNALEIGRSDMRCSSTSLSCGEVANDLPAYQE